MEYDDRWDDLILRRPRQEPGEFRDIAEKTVRDLVKHHPGELSEEDIERAIKKYERYLELTIKILIEEMRRDEERPPDDEAGLGV